MMECEISKGRRSCLRRVLAVSGAVVLTLAVGVPVTVAVVGGSTERRLTEAGMVRVAELIEKHADKFEEAIRNDGSPSLGEFVSSIVDPQSLEHLALSPDGKDVLDGWGRPLRVFVLRSPNRTYLLASGGADGDLAREDDNVWLLTSGVQ